MTALKTLNLYFISHISVLQTPDKNNEVVRKLEQDLELKTLEQTQQRQDYEDLLVLLEDQDSKIKKFKVSILTHSLKCLSDNNMFPKSPLFQNDKLLNIQATSFNLI